MRDVAPVAIVSAHQPRDKTGQSLVLSTVDPCVPAQEDGRRSIVISTLVASALCRVTTPLGNVRLAGKERLGRHPQPQRLKSPDAQWVSG